MAILSDSQVQDLKNQWNNLNYDQQQQYLKSNSKLQWALNSLWLSVKSNPSNSIINNTTTTQVAKNTTSTPTIWGQQVTTKTPTTNNPTIWGKSMLNNGTTPVGNSVLWGSNIQPVSMQQNWTKPVGNSVLGWSNIQEVNMTKQPKSILDKVDTTGVNQFTIWGKVIASKPTAQNEKTPTKQTTVSTARTSWNTWYASPQQQERDYQDNSQARMDQIANNLNKYKQTNPELFKDYDTFYNFFIAWKGRSEDQRRFLDQYYADYKQNEKWNNMSADDVWSWIANGAIPEDYINTVASTDPNRAAAIKDALKNTQDWIANEWYLSSLANSLWFDMDIYPQQVERWNEQWLFIDEDHNWIDDRREHYATQEERELNDWVLEATRRLMQNHVTERDMIDNIIDQYPDIDYSTAVLLANDRNQKLYKQDDALNISIAQMNWTLQYLQKEREEKNKAWADTIAQLQKNLSLYYQYSPQWMKELADAQYAANNITLEQAENWTDTDKQRALDQVLQWYYDKYWDIIQRPKSQVINDIINEANTTWKSLADALNDNFITPLKSKPQYDLISAWGSANGSWTLEAIKDADGNIVWYVKIDKNTGKIEWLDWTIGWLSWTWLWWYNWTNNWKFTDYTPISESELRKKLNEFQFSYTWEDWKFNKKWWQCGEFVNDYLEKLWYNRLYTDPIDKKAAITNTDTPNVWAVAVMNSKNYPQYWHTAIVTKVYQENGKTYVDLLESNRWWDEKVHLRTKHDASDIIWYFDPTINPNTNYWYWENPMSSYLTQLWKKDLNADQRKDLKFVNQTYNLLYRIASSWDLDHLMKSWDLEKLIQNMNSKSFQSIEWDKTFSAVKSMLTKNISDQTNLKTIWDIAELITLKLRKESWAAISAWEWTSWFESFLPWAWENYDTALAKYIRFEQDYLMPSLSYAWWNMKDYKSLFSPNSPYYKKEWATSNTKTTTTNTKWTWNIGTSNTQNNNYNSLYSILGI